MKKNAFFTLVCLLFSLWAQAQNLVTINGVVTNASDNSPVANQLVFCFAGDSLNPVFGQSTTNPDGTYLVEIDLPAGSSEVFVGTLSYCDPLNPFATQAVDVTTTGQGTANFVICSDSFPPVEECFVDFIAVPTDTLTFEFYGYFYSLVDSSATAVSYLWDFGDGSPLSTDATPTHTYAADGLYIVTLAITGSDGCESRIQYPVETSFHGLPECFGYLMYTQTGTTDFNFSSVLYDATGNQVQGVTYSWDFGDGNTSSDPTPSHSYASEGVYTVLMHATTEDGCEIHTCDVVFAMECLVDTFWYGCQAMYSASIGGFDAVGNPIDPLSVAFFDMSLGGVVSWAWNFGDGTTSNEQNPVHTYAQEGVYVVSLSITTLDGCESTAVFEICIGENCWLPELDCQALFLPIPDSLGGNGIQFLDFSISSNPVTTWSWDFGDGTTSNEQNPYHVFAQPGVYAVSLSIEGDSCSSVITFELDTESPWNFNDNGGDPAKLGQSTNSVATREANAAFESVKLFPNPAHNDLSVAFSSKQAGDYTVRISDLTGKTLQTSAQTAVIGVNAARLNIGNLVPGLYMAEIRSGESVQTIKFVKE